MSEPEGQITQLLKSWTEGDKSALELLVPLVEVELRRLARRYMNRQDSGHTLQTSDLINEAYLRLIDQRTARWQDRNHFFAASAQIMRHILIDHARRRLRAKHGAGARKVSLDETVLVQEERARELVALDEALTELESIDPRKSKIVELRFFGGMNIEEAAEMVGTSPATVQREWRAARAWLQRALTDNQLSSGPNQGS